MTHREIRSAIIEVRSTLRSVPVAEQGISKDTYSLRRNREEMLLIMNKDVKAPDNSSLSVKTSYGLDPSTARDVGTLFYREVSKTLTNGSCPGHHNGVLIVYEKE